MEGDLAVESALRYPTPMPKDVVLITGASSGIGEALARRIARDGRHLALVARRADRLEALARELKEQHGIGTHVVARDLTRAGSVSEVLREIERQDLIVDWLVNNAGFGTYGR